MNKDSILLELQKVFQTVFKNDELSIDLGTSQTDIETWDSLNHAILFEAIEKYFDVKFNLMDMITIQKVDDICEKILQLKQAD